MSIEGTSAVDVADEFATVPHPAAVPVGEKLFDVVGGFALRRVHVSEARPWTGIPDVLPRLELEEFERQRRIAAEAESEAQSVLARARVEADSILGKARQQARTLGHTQLKAWQTAFDARQVEVADSLGEAVGVVVESVLRKVLASSEDLPIRMTLELAMRALSSELRAAAVCHPMDLPEVQAHAERLGTTSVATNAALPRGQILFTSAEGEVKVDAERMIERLMLDLRTAFKAGPSRSDS